MNDPVTPKANDGQGDNSTTLTPTESRFFVNIVLNLNTKVDVNWEKVAEQSGFKNAGVAKTRFGQIKRKLGIRSAGTSDKQSPSGSAKATTAPRTPRKPKAEGGVTKPRGSGKGKGKARVKTEDADEDDDVEAGDRKVKQEIKQEDADGEEVLDAGSGVAEQLIADNAGHGNGSDNIKADPAPVAYALDEEVDYNSYLHSY